MKEVIKDGLYSLGGLYFAICCEEPWVACFGIFVVICNTKILLEDVKYTHRQQ